MPNLYTIFEFYFAEPIFTIYCSLILRKELQSYVQNPRILIRSHYCLMKPSWLNGT